MSKLAHRIYILSMTGIVVVTSIYLFIKGTPYYLTPLEERFYHPDHDFFKPSGLFGHGLGILGTLLILIGVFGYIAKKRYKFLARLGRLKYWLEFHIFLCTLGPIMILFHTAFKFGGIVSISFWSMVAVVASGVIGRFIYIQIPRSIEGQALSLNEIKNRKYEIEQLLSTRYHLDRAQFNGLMKPKPTSGALELSGSLLTGMVHRYIADRHTIRVVRKTLRKNRLNRKDSRHILSLVKNELSLNNRIERLQLMQQLFKYWHVAHLPFAIIMLVIMVLHVGVTLAFGYKWIF